MESEDAKNLVTDRPDLANGLRALPNECLDQRPWLRRAMEHKHIYPLIPGDDSESDSGSNSDSDIEKADTKLGRFYKAKYMQVVKIQNDWLADTEEDKEAIVEDLTGLIAMSFTGTMVQVEDRGKNLCGRQMLRYHIFLWFTDDY